MANNTCEVVVGRVLEIRLVAGYSTPEDVDDMIKKIGAGFGKIPADQRVIIAADWRVQRIMNPDTAARAKTMLSAVNPRILRSAILTAPQNATTNMQVVRLVRESQNAERQHFIDVDAARVWLQEVMTNDEQQRIDVFLKN